VEKPSRPVTFGPAYARASLPFRAVNRRGARGYAPGLQRHHLLPSQLLSMTCFSRILDRIGRNAIGFNDFRRNGLLLPADEQTALRTGMPLHRGPHKRYNEVVIERIGRIERGWAQAFRCDEERARSEALSRINVLQLALRKRLLSRRHRPLLNSRDPLGAGIDFAVLDAMAETIWEST